MLAFNKVYAQKNGVEGASVVLYHITDELNNEEKFLIHKGIQTLQLSSLDKYEEITNESIVNSLIEEHNFRLSRLKESDRRDPNINPLDMMIYRREESY